MRCRECNIDVADNISCCPLCGAEVFDDAPALPQLGDIPYPSSYQPYPKEKRTFTSFSAAKYSARAAALFAPNAKRGFVLLPHAVGVGQKRDCVHNSQRADGDCGGTVNGVLFAVRQRTGNGCGGAYEKRH